MIACSNSDDSSVPEATRDVRSTEEYDQEMDHVESGDYDQDDTMQIDNTTNQEQKIINEGYFELQVKNYQEALQKIETQIAEQNGYVIHNETWQLDNDLREGRITARIPQQYFQSFPSLLESDDIKIIHHNTSGQDVTEQYVDLESRLNSKKVVEERLLNFMDEAETTEDLLNISRDLAKIQEEIEQITGRMNYLDNKTDLATITLSIYEDRVDRIGDQDLNTWERTKQQLLRSYNFIFVAGSNLIVFFIGNLPVLAVFLLIGLPVYFYWKRKKNGRE